MTIAGLVALALSGSPTVCGRAWRGIGGGVLKVPFLYFFYRGLRLMLVNLSFLLQW
jgi:hypothetical protein